MRSQRVCVCMVDVERSWILRKWQQAPIPSSFSKPIVFKSKPLDAFRRTKKPKGRNFGTRILDQCCLTQRQLLLTIEMTSKCSKLMWNHEPQESGFILHFLTFWLHFYGRYEYRQESYYGSWYRPWKIVVDFFFTLTVFVVHFRWLFAENRLWGREKQTAPPSFHFHSL